MVSTTPLLIPKCLGGSISSLRQFRAGLQVVSGLCRPRCPESVAPPAMLTRGRTLLARQEGQYITIQLYNITMAMGKIFAALVMFHVHDGTILQLCSKEINNLIFTSCDQYRSRVIISKIKSEYESTIETID